MKQTLLDYVNTQEVTRVDMYHKDLPTDPEHISRIKAILGEVEVKCCYEPLPAFRCQYESYGKEANSFGITLATEGEMRLNFLTSDSQSIGGLFRKKYAGMHISGDLNDTHYTIFIRGE